MLSYQLVSQISFGVSISGLGYHPTPDANSHVYKWKIDKKGKFIGFTGLTFAVSYRYNDYIGIKFVQTLVFHDCAGRFAGVSHIGIDFHDDIICWDWTKSHFSASFGPLWYYRRNWCKNPEYVNNPEFMKLTKSRIWENKFVWYGGQIEYAYKFNTTDAATINLFPGHPYLYSFSLGVKRTMDN
ncbi:MAG: hypothetical protein C0596_16715 [Marinilabiliales bacterium]|nr:MAG: hypothetical protein C0596_16715 [Marinilabiliales bacterium]